ncbi:unnamed protein product [Rotaria sordida]|uniref:Uncharacterized protein n=1 Tax=Rotaria sordida TaxID=392033 RepID=A0A819Z8L2_9BILA|nr:unnamed protein product [Rotaria sordida]
MPFNDGNHKDIRVDQVHDHINSMPNAIKDSSNDLILYPKRNNYAISSKEETEPETLYVNMNVGSNEVLETKYVNLFIDTKSYVNNIIDLFKY